MRLRAELKKINKSGGPEGRAASEAPRPLSCELLTRHLSRTGRIERRKDM